MMTWYKYITLKEMLITRVHSNNLAKGGIKYAAMVAD